MHEEEEEEEEEGQSESWVCLLYYMYEERKIRVIVILNVIFLNERRKITQFIVKTKGEVYKF